MKIKILFFLSLLATPFLHTADQQILKPELTGVIRLPDKMIHSIHFHPFENILLVQEQPPLVTNPSPHETYSLKLHTYDLTNPSMPQQLATYTIEDCKRIGLLKRCMFRSDGTLLFAAVKIDKDQEEYLVIEDASDNRILISLSEKNKIRNILFSRHGHYLLVKYADCGKMQIIDIENKRRPYLEKDAIKDAVFLGAIESEEGLTCLLKMSLKPFTPKELIRMSFSSHHHKVKLSRLKLNPIIGNEVPLSAMSNTGLMYLVEESDGQELGLFYNMQDDDVRQVPYLFLPSSTALSCDGTLFVGIDGDGILHIIDVNSYKVLCTTTLFPQRKSVHPEFTGFDLIIDSLSFNHDSSLLAVASREDAVPQEGETDQWEIKIWDLRGHQTAMDQDGTRQQRAKRKKRHPERRWRKKRARKIRNGKLPSEAQEEVGATQSNEAKASY